MSRTKPDPIAIAVRVYAEPPREKPPRSRRIWKLPEAMLVFDTETRTDAAQRLTFGSYRFLEDGRCLEEGLFYAPDLPQQDRKTLENYVTHHSAQTVKGGVPQLGLLTLAEFLDKLFLAAYKGRCLLVAFNFPFDISRLAYDHLPARGRFAGGISLGLWQWTDKSGIQHPDRYRPRVGIKQIDSKRALKGFTARTEPDKADLIPEDSETGEPEEGYKFRGHFLDLRTLAFALTDESYSLETACEAFGVEHGKQRVRRHGVVTKKYIDYNRRDVLATVELAHKLLEEYAKHPITLQATKAYSPASIGKAYLRAMGIPPVLERQPDFPTAYLGYAQSAFFGGRTSAHIRKIPVPVVYTDFLSMYPTVNSLMDLWSLVTARKIVLIEHCKGGIERFLRRLTPEKLFDPATWKGLAAFVRIIPDGDILPTRGRYSEVSNDWQVASNYLHPKNEGPDEALWFSLPDVAALVLLTGRIPTIVDAFRIKARGRLPGLKSTQLRGAVDVDPRKRDFFRAVIEERKRLPFRSDLSEKDKKRLDKALKVLANAASYGIYAEMIREESDKKVKVVCHGIDAEPFSCSAAHPDVPGEYCFPPFASLITGAARLMLALLEYCIWEKGGTYAMEDTDSMAIVATKDGGLIPCPGGPEKTKKGRQGVRALSWKQVEEIAERFAALNPYDRDAVPGSILKIEDDNRDPRTGKRRQLWCYAISAKRYALFLWDQGGPPQLLRRGTNNKQDRWSQHGLGHLLNPTDPESEDRDWIAQAWISIVRKGLGLRTRGPRFGDVPAVGRVTVSSPVVMRPLESLNEGKSYPDQIKPFNFLLSCHVKQLGHPIGVNPEHFHLIAPYESDSRSGRSWIGLTNTRETDIA